MYFQRTGRFDLIHKDSGSYFSFFIERTLWSEADGYKD